jgi:hypothetical protein
MSVKQAAFTIINERDGEEVVSVSMDNYELSCDVAGLSETLAQVCTHIKAAWAEPRKEVADN